jgi:hypothetical protein
MDVAGAKHKASLSRFGEAPIDRFTKKATASHMLL